ncbi:hypothetical protein CPter91_3474 [Collimonas pratensis]|uniref:Uncharacterized protein n=2 Tax=Collimonas pratensis TaxID=279113 RepID=A0A127Q6V2_9BURK|nr:hypothetical protein CPter91_3474 [Collimonas pratensis]
MVFIMAALDRNRVEIFAHSKGVTNIASFFRTLDRSNLWNFARRPLDLGWLVEYWQEKNSFGHLAEMLELSIFKRLQETDMNRARKDTLDQEKAMKALERIGAAMVLQRLNTIEVPDGGKDIGEDTNVLDLAEILSDLSSLDRTLLITRAVFDPANAGFVRFHNDNEGNVRAYLAARWLKRLRSINCPRSVIRELLFATNYGIPLVKPSMRDTAAWLALWDIDVANQIIEIDPRLLMSAGDPASLSLSVRTAILTQVITQIEQDVATNVPESDMLRRFSAPDMVPFIREKWNSHLGSAPVRELLLLMISLGEHQSCSDIAIAASFGKYTDHYTQIFSGRALLATASLAERTSYAAYIRDNASTVQTIVVWDAISELFPNELSVSDLLLILAVPKLHESGGDLGLGYYGPKLIDRLTDASDITSLLTEIFSRLRMHLPANRTEYEAENNPFTSILDAGCRRLIALSGNEPLATLVIDIALYLSELQLHYSPRQSQIDTPDLFDMLSETPIRRRSTFWRCAEVLSKSEKLRGVSLVAPWQIEIHGFLLGIKLEDLDWLLIDASTGISESDQKLAVNTAMRAWREWGELEEILARITAFALGKPEIEEVVTSWTTPRVPSTEELAIEKNTHERRQKNSSEEIEIDKSWRDFADNIRADPGQLRTIKTPTDNGVDARLYYLWQILSRYSENQSRYSIDDLSPLRPLFGDAVITALRDAFLRHWRNWSPTSLNARPENERNTRSAMDLIGIVGVTLEAVNSPNWTSKLTDEEARRAAAYATLELNGFPSWLSTLATNKPDPVREVLRQHIEADLITTSQQLRRDALETVSQADTSIVQLIANDIFTLVEATPVIPLQLLNPALRILCRAYVDHERLLDLLIQRSISDTEIPEKACYLAFAYGINPQITTTTLTNILADIELTAQTALVQEVLPRLAGNGWSRGEISLQGLSVTNLEQLVLLAFATLLPEEDNKHTNGRVYAPDERDHAESARSTVFNILVNTPGPATFAAIQRMISKPGFPIPQQRLVALSLRRAEQDAETAPWISSDVRKFEMDFLTVPNTPIDLQRVTMQRLADIQEELVDGDFNQGKVVARLPKEVDVQNWIANILHERRGRSYTLEREPHVAEEKEPDIRLRAKGADASLPIEIKVAESWTLKELEQAITLQLMGRYLRDPDDRWGILLVVHQIPRQQGWKIDTGQFLTFSQVVEHLRESMKTIAISSRNAPQMDLAVIDVSRVPIR